MAYAAKVEKQMLPVLQNLKENPPKDAARYDFVLRDAVETTADSLPGLEKDPEKRAAAVEARSAKEKAATKETLETPESKDKDKPADDKKADDAEKPAKKPPTLYRPGEKKGGGQ
jgi:hypothetical protein